MGKTKQKGNAVMRKITELKEKQEIALGILLYLDEVCRKLNVSAAYFSTIFKKETGKTFVRYLTDYRMEKAVNMLMTGNEKTYVIAEKVGYAEPNYFSYVFKKQFGMSPSKYKAERLEQK